MSAQTRLFQSEYARCLREEGHTEAEAEAVPQVPRCRWLHVSDEAADHVLTCTDSHQVQTWLDRAWGVEHADSLFTPDR